jgi:hypothetical protein
VVPLAAPAVAIKVKTPASLILKHPQHRQAVENLSSLHHFSDRSQTAVCLLVRILRK